MSPAAITAPVESLPETKASTRDPLAAHLITAAAFILLAALVSIQWSALVVVVLREWPVLGMWCIIIGIINLFPLQVEDFSLTLDLPLLLALALSISPEAAAAVSFMATVDTREVGGERVGFSRALFNRSQVSLSVLIAGWAFHKVSPGLSSLPLAALGTALALLVDYLLNISLVILHLSARRSLRLGDAARKLTVGALRRFLATYLGFGVMALVLAHLAQEVGFWPVVVFLVPILVAREALLRDLELQQAASRLVAQGRLLEKALDRSIDERKDERMRIAGQLHDEVLQSLISLRMCADLVGGLHAREATALQEAADLVSKVDTSIDRLREVIGGLRRSPVGPGGLVPTLQALVRDFSLDWGRRIVLEVSGDVALPGNAQVLLYQVLREALLNALRHSGARLLRVCVARHRCRIEATVEDNGIGFVPTEGENDSHFGLALIRERVGRLGGEVEIHSEPEKGTRLSVAIPLGNDREPR